MQRNLYIIAGCNGAGKTTASFTMLPELLRCKEFVNADAIAAALCPFDPASVAIKAGRIMLERIAELLEAGVDFALETTLSTRSYHQLIRTAREKGYRVSLLYFWLRSAEMAINRVASRVEKGGHHIPEDVIRRRYERGIQNLFETYQHLTDRLFIFDNSDTSIELIAHRKSTVRMEVLNPDKFNAFNNMVHEPEMVYGDELLQTIIAGLQLTYSRLIDKTIAENSYLVVFRDGEIKRIYADEWKRERDAESAG